MNTGRYTGNVETKYKIPNWSKISSYTRKPYGSKGNKFARKESRLWNLVFFDVNPCNYGKM